MKKVFFAILACLLFVQVKAQINESSVTPGNMVSPEVYYGLFVPETRTYRAVATYPGAVLFEWMTMSPGWKFEKAPGSFGNDMHDVLIIPTSSSAPTTMLGVRAFDGVEWSGWTGVGYVSMTDSYSLSDVTEEKPIMLLNVD